MTRDQLLELLSTSSRQDVEVPGLGVLAVRPLRLSEVLAVWETTDNDGHRQLALIAAAVVGEDGEPLASAEEWDRLLGALPAAWPVLAGAVNRAQGFNAEAIQGN